MKLSVIIVNYNVQYFLELALQAVRKASVHLDMEVFVVDNCSSDGSVQMVREHFPEVMLIANQDNVGFSRANNQAIRLAKGEYVLLLNPDTVVREDTFTKTVAFMDAHPEAGGLGVKMIDGTGKFLPESKRGFPSPAVAFYKTFGLSRIFPRSRRFNHYHLGYLSENENHEVEVLSGAFMLMRKAALDKVGLLDEAFFMYGEDIDLSYRILLGGYKNYYFSDTEIIHYKGESTKKGSLNYVKTFYQAMIIFARKHFQGRQARWFIALLQFAIYFRAFITLAGSIARSLYMPLIEAGLIYLGLWLGKEGWEWLHFGDPYYYDYHNYLYSFNFPLYTAIWIIALYLRGGYDRQPSAGQLLTGIGGGTLLIAAVYGFLPVHLRSSRMLILLGTFSSALSVLGFRAAHNLLRYRKVGLSGAGKAAQQIAIVGSLEESKRVLHLLYQTHHRPNFIGTISPQPNADRHFYIGSLDQLDDLVQWYAIEELIFCAKDVSNEAIIYWMDRMGSDFYYKIVPEQSDSIIGSNSKNTAGDSYTTDISFNLSSPFHRRNKRLLDLFLCLASLAFLPLLLLVIRRRGLLLRSWAAVLVGKKTWVGYVAGMRAAASLPKLPPAVLSPLDSLAHPPQDEETIQRLHLFYAKDYSVYGDLRLWWKGLR